MQLSDAVAERLYPGEFRRPLNGRALDRPDVELFVARSGNGNALGCAALFYLGEGTAELKRMIVAPEHAGRGVGRSILVALLAEAVRRGLTTILLEVGTRNVEARRLYASLGFRERGPFGTYQATSVAGFMEICLPAT
ncbi:GNAT family N-acetyltransferase [Ciceribacter lividus]|nr:GNAT family N-acetyltransferase [Ciceribacter lividus]